eukprot:3124236-Rhodomonas_salina.2
MSGPLPRSGTARTLHARGRSVQDAPGTSASLVSRSPEPRSISLQPRTIPVRSGGLSFVVDAENHCLQVSARPPSACDRARPLLCPASGH